MGVIAGVLNELRSVKIPGRVWPKGSVENFLGALVSFIFFECGRGAPM